MNRITVTEDVRECPQCGGSTAIVSKHERACWTCVIMWTFVPPEDENEEEEWHRVNSRAYAEQIKRPKPIRGIRW